MGDLEIKYNIDVELMIVEKKRKRNYERWINEIS